MNYLNEFNKPSARFRGAPFWAWNCKLDEKQLMRQIEYFKEMGFGGATIHCRTGLDTPYLGDEFMNIVEKCVEKSESLGMKVYLYDEDRWPSGFGGGEVTKNSDFRVRYLVFTARKPEDLLEKAKIFHGSNATASIQGNGTIAARYEVELTDGYLRSYRRLRKDETGNHVFYAYLEVKGDDPWYNNQAYVDALNRSAIKCFIGTSYEKYAKRFGEKFGGTIPSIFTDEPQLTCETTFGQAADSGEAIIPYTTDFEETYEKTYGEKFLDFLPEIFWELPDGKISTARYRYHDHIAERFAEAYFDTVGKWCSEHGIALTGHLMDERTLYSQTRALGEAMRHYRGFTIPGIDMLCDQREYSTAKQAQSAAHQIGSNEVTSELYGVTNWDFDFRGHKLQGDWQAALGVTHRVPHLAWVSMKGEAKRDYPASISYQSPWSAKYSLLETYFARVNTALMSGKPHVRIGVIHPIESYWLFFGPDEQTKEMRDKLEKQFSDVIKWLLFGLMDFDFISESLWNSLEDGSTDSKITVGAMKYDVIVVPGLVTYRSTTIKRLDNFVKKGGKVVFMGEIGHYVDAVPSSRPEGLAQKGLNIKFEKAALLRALLPYRDMDMRDSRGVRSDHYIYQMREIENGRIVFIANAFPAKNIDVPVKETYRIVFAGTYAVEMLDAMTGGRKRIKAYYSCGNTEITHDFYEEDSLLLFLSRLDGEKGGSSAPSINEAPAKFVKSLNTVEGYKLSEPNVLMLDQADYSVDGEAYMPSEEVLRIDNILRERFDYPLKMEAYAQPWTRTGQPENDGHKLKLRYHVHSDVDKLPLKLAVEYSAGMKLFWNGNTVPLRLNGYYVDESIKTFSLPDLSKGENELVIEMDYNRWSDLEWCYLLGDFGTYLYGNQVSIVPLKEKIGFSSLTDQGFAFYGGNISYCMKTNLSEGEYELEVTKYRASLLSVCVDGRSVGDILFSPYRISLGYLNEGQHVIEIFCYGNRINTFGTVHNCDENTKWFGPQAWRSCGAAYSYEYQLKRTGILAAPKLYIKE